MSNTTPTVVRRLDFGNNPNGNIEEIIEFYDDGSVRVELGQDRFGDKPWDIAVATLESTLLALHAGGVIDLQHKNLEEALGTVIDTLVNECGDD